MLAKLFPTSLVGSYPQPDWLIDRARLAKMVPRGSAPARTSASSHPGTGFLTRWLTEASHWPLTLSTLSFPAAISESMTDELPMVPAMITVLAGFGSTYLGPSKL